MEIAREAAPGGIAKVLAAAEFAAFKHREQRRKGVSGSPYINHPLAVASTLATEAGVEDEIDLGPTWAVSESPDPHRV